MATIDDKLIGIYSSHAIHLERVAAQFGSAVTPYLENIDKRVGKVLSSMGKVTTESRQAVIAEINAIAKEELQAFTDEYKANNKELAESEIDFHVSTLSALMDDVAIASTTVSAVNTLAVNTPFPLGNDEYTTYQRYVSTYWKTYADKIDSAVRAGFIEGQTNREIALAIQANIDPVLTKASKAAKTMARTGTSFYSNQATKAFVDKNDKILKGYRFVATLDSVTSQSCRSLDGQTFDKNDKKMPLLPLHPNCRSKYIYDIADDFKVDNSTAKRPSNFREADTDLLDPKQVSSKSTYYKELDELSAKDQDLVLGPTLGKAFRKMDNPDKFAKQMIDSTYQPLTIKELRGKNNELGRILKGQMQ